MPFVGINQRIGFNVIAAISAISLASCAGRPSRIHEIGASAAPLAEIGLNIPMNEETLSNGLHVILVEDHTVPVVSYQTWIRAGSVDERPGTTGIAHLFEHLMFKGTKKYGEKQFFMQLEAKGAEVNAFTMRDYTVFYENLVPSLLEKAIDMESDRLGNLSVNEDALTGEKLVVLEERRLRSENTPEGRMDEAIWKLAFFAHPYRWPIIGYPEDLQRVRAEDLDAFFKAHYQPENAAVVVVGDFDSASVLSLIRKYYGPIPGRSRPSRSEIAVEPQQTGERRLVIRDSVESERWVQAYHVPSALDDDAYALDVLSQILFSGTSSRAYRALVDDARIALNIGGSDFTPTYPGLFLITCNMRTGVPSEKGEEIVNRLVHTIQKDGVSAEEVKAAVRQLTVEVVDGTRTPQGLGNLIGTVYSILGDARKVGDDVMKYLKVTPADVQRVAEKYLDPNNRSVVTLVPK